MNDDTCLSLLSKTDCENLKDNDITIDGNIYPVIKFTVNPTDPDDGDELAIPPGCSVVLDTGNAHAFFNDGNHKTTTCTDIFSGTPGNSINCLCKKPPTTPLVISTTQTGKCANQLTREQCLQARNADPLALTSFFLQRNNDVDVPNGCMYQDLSYFGSGNQYWYSNLDGTNSDGNHEPVGVCATTDPNIPTTCVCAQGGAATAPCASIDEPDATVIGTTVSTTHGSTLAFKCDNDSRKTIIHTCNDGAFVKTDTCPSAADAQAAALTDVTTAVSQLDTPTRKEVLKTVSSIC